MSDSSPMWISIGGTLKEEDVGDFAELIAELGLDYGEMLGEDAENTVRTHDGKTPLQLFDHERPGGMYEELEQFCREHDLSYARGDDGHYTYPAMCQLWVPGMAEPKDWISANDCGSPYLSINEIDALTANGGLEAELALMRQLENFAVPFSAPAWPAETEAA